ncbi:MAG TPA: TIGR01777 family oxidoreductase [Cyclobacteriaceae bacterium]
MLIGGGSGLIGTHLTEKLLQKGHQVRHLGRKAKEGQVKTFGWDIHRQTVDKRAFEGVDVVINLAGANINGRRWTEAYKKELLVSRTGSTQLIVDAIKDRDDVQFIAGSAIGYYGFGSGDQWFRETDPAGTDFMAQVTIEWEKVASQVKNVAIIRTGIVISEEGGAIEEMARPIKLYVGSPLGSGKQIVSWIHLEDECGIIMHVMENKLHGIFNATAPEPASNAEITKELAKKLHKPLWAPNVPAFILEIVLGPMSESVLNGSRVSSEKIASTGYNFQYPTIESALQ